MNFVKHIFIIILLLVLIVSIVGLSLLATYKLTISTPSYVKKVMEESRIYESMYENIATIYEDTLTSTGIEFQEVKDFFKLEDMKRDVNLVIDDLYDNNNVVTRDWRWGYLQNSAISITKR